MDRSLFERAVMYHGSDFDRLVKEEQIGASFLTETGRNDETTKTKVGALNDIVGTSLAVVANMAKANNEQISTSAKRKDNKRRSKDRITGSSGEFDANLHGFIARKADLLFRNPDDNLTITDFPSEKDDEKSDYYAIVPPLEQFLGVDAEICQERLFSVLKVGDIVCGQILNTKEFGIFVKLLALCRDTSCFLHDCEVVALLPAGELRDRFSNVATVGDFSVGDLLRAVVTKVTAEEQKVIISLHAREDIGGDTILGLITNADLPVHYRRSVLQLDSLETYGDMLESTVGFDNPFNVAYLGAKLGLSNAAPMSLMRGLQRGNFPEKEFSEPLRKWQTNRWSMESVARGVEHFKAGRFLEAMKHLNKALEIDEENVEALVARGALYANRDHLSKALGDFSKALKINPTHRNANKYMCETLLERGKQLEESGSMEKAKDCYQAAIEIKPGFLEAQLCLSNIKKIRSTSKKVSSPESISSTCTAPGSPAVISAEALRQMVETENHASSRTKADADKSKKKKKKKGRDKDNYSSRKNDKLSSKSKRKSDKKKSKYSPSFSSDASASPKPSSSRAKERSGRKLSRDEKKRERSSSSKKRGDPQRRRKNTDSFSSSSSSERSKSWTRRSKSRSRSRHRSDRQKTKHRSKRSASYSESNSIDKSSSSKRKKQGGPLRDQLLSPHSSSESSYSSRSPEVSRRKSILGSDKRKSKDEKRQARGSRMQTKTGVSRSPSTSPRSRRRSLSKDLSRSHKRNDVKRQKDGTVIEDFKSRNKAISKDDSCHSPRSHSRDKSPYKDIKKSKRRKDDVKNKDVNVEKSKDNKETKDYLEKTQRDDNKYKHISKHPTGSTHRKTCKEKEDGKKRRPSDSDLDSSNDEESRVRSKNSSGRVKDSTRRRENRSNPQDAERGRRGKNSPDGRTHSKSNSYSSDDSFSDGSFSDRSYSSYSLSGSRSYSYSSYSSYTVSGSSSDDGSIRKKEEFNKSRKRPRQRDQVEDRSSNMNKSKTSNVRNREDNLDDEEDEDSDSDVDTGIYEISRDHLEMYMESKSYHIKKTDEGTPLKRKKRKHSEEEKEDKSRKKSKPENQGKSRLSDDEKDKIPVLPEDANKEVQKMPETVSEPPLDVKPATKKRHFTENKPQERQTSSPHHGLPATDKDVAKPANDNAGIYNRAYIHPSVQNVPFHRSLVDPKQAVVPNTGQNQREVSHQTEVSDIGPRHRSNTGINQQQLLLPRQCHPLVPGNDSHKLPLPRESEVDENSTIPDVGRNLIGQKDFTEDMFTPEQLAVISTISKQLEKIRQQTLQENAARSELISVNDGAHHDQRTQEGYDAMRGERSADVKGQGHHIGVIVTRRANNNDQETRPKKGEGNVPSFEEQSVDSGILSSDQTRDRIMESGGVVPQGEGKPVPVSIDYKHGQNLTIESEERGMLHVAPEVPSHTAFESVRSSSSVAVQQGQAQRSQVRVTEGTDLKKQKHRDDRSRRKSGDMQLSKSHHDGKGHRSHGDRHVDESSTGRTYYYSTRTDDTKNMDVTNHPGHAGKSSSSTKVDVIDYQHGRSERHVEKSTSNKHRDRHGERPRGNHHESSYERHQKQRDSRDIYHQDRQTDRGGHHSWNRDSDRYHGRSSDTHSDRYHSRTHDRFSDRRGSTERSRTAAGKPKESNPFHKLVTFNKDIQVASLHSEGKWGHDHSPDVKKPSSSRSWWL